MTTANIIDGALSPRDAALIPNQGTATSPMIGVQGVHKDYKRGDTTVPVLRDLEMRVERGRFLALMGPSGSGKTTLLNILAGLDRATRGAVTVAGSRLDQLSDRQLTAWRSRHVGFIFQAFNLIPVLTALENVELPLLLTPLGRRERRKRAATALSLVGLSDRGDHFPRQLSGGQEQRVAIARSIVADPELIVADEPTGDLDRQSANEVLELLCRLAREFDKTIVMVTHDPMAAERADVVRHMDKGALV